MKIYLHTLFLHLSYVYNMALSGFGLAIARKFNIAVEDHLNRAKTAALEEVNLRRNTEIS